MMRGILSTMLVLIMEELLLQNSQISMVMYLFLEWRMHLIRAESNFRLSSSKGMTPLSEINTLRARSNANLYQSLVLIQFLMKGSLSLPLRSPYT